MTKLDRRRFVVSASALSATALLNACPGGDGVDGGSPGDGDGDGDGEPDGGELPTGPGPEPDAMWVPDGDVDEAAFPLGVQTGDARPTSIIASIQSDTASIDVALARASDAGWVELERIAGLTTTDGFVQIEVTDLVPEHTYGVVAYVAGTADRSDVARFRTAVPVDETRSVRFGATSCLGGNEPWGSLSAVATEKLDFLCLLGDTVYVDEVPDGSIGAHWKSKMGIAGLRDALASTSIIATWDDHEVDNDWNFDTIGERFGIARTAFRRHLPQRPGDNDTIWRKISWGTTLDLFVLDCRGERIDGNYISQAQMDWLKEGLSSSTARFKLILNTVPIIDFNDLPFGAGSIAAEDRWQGFPAQRTELLNHIVENDLQSILFLSGDFHLGGWATVDVLGGPADHLFEVLTGPAGSQINVASQYLNENERYQGLVDVHNTCIFECNPDEGTIRVDFINDAGASVKSTFFEL